MTTARESSALDGAPVPFAEIGKVLARTTCSDAGAAGALVATLVAVGPQERLQDAAEVVQALGEAGTVRGILISEGEDSAPPATVQRNTVILRGLKAAYVDNAVAALRLSSLPTALWWRGGRPETLDDLVHLADRIVLDELDPGQIWRRAAQLFDHTAISDLRWAHLTQWRALMAHFFDIPEVRTAASQFTRLRITGADMMSTRLFAAWLTSSIAFRSDFVVDIQTAQGLPMQAVELGDGAQQLTLRVAGAATCLETSVCVSGHKGVTRLVGRVEHTLRSILTEELKIRARDDAFERAIVQLVAT